MLRLQLLLGLAAALRPGSAPARTARRPRPLAAGPGGDVTSADDGFSAEDGGFSAEDGLSAEDAALARELADLAVGAELAARQKKVQKGGANRVAAQYVHALTAAHPSELVRDFYAEASPQALAAIQEAILGLVGSAGDVDAEYRATGASVADLCLRLQMTGYMLRNAEYVIALQQLLRLGDRGRTVSDFRAAFRRVDSDDSGFIDYDEVEALFKNVYGESADRAAEASNFVRFFDTNKDGKVSFAEFCDALGGAAPNAGRALGPGVDDVTVADPAVSGSMQVDLPGGGTRTVDASQYFKELKEEAARLRGALQQTAQRAGPELATIAGYIGSLEAEQRDVLVSMSGDARTAAGELVRFVLAGGAEDSGAAGLEAESEVTLEKRVLEQIVRWQLVVGYRLRELEAQNDAQRRLGA